MKGRFKVNKTTCKSLGMTTQDKNCISKDECNFFNPHHFYNETARLCQHCGEKCYRKSCTDIIISDASDINDNCTTVQSLKIINLNDNPEENVMKLLQKAFSNLYDVKNCIIVENSTGIQNLKFLHPQLKISGSCKFDNQQYSLVIINNDNLSSLFNRNEHSRRLTTENVFIERNRALCKETLDYFIKTANIKASNSQIQNSTCAINEIYFEAYEFTNKILLQAEVLPKSDEKYELKCKTDAQVTINPDYEDETNMWQLSNLDDNTKIDCNVKIMKNNLTLHTSLPQLKTLTIDFKVDPIASGFRIKYSFNDDAITNTNYFYALAAQLCNEISEESTLMSDTHLFRFEETFLKTEIAGIQTDIDANKLENAYSFVRVNTSQKNIIIDNLRPFTCYDIKLLYCIQSNIFKCKEILNVDAKTLEEAIIITTNEATNENNAETKVKIQLVLTTLIFITILTAVLIFYIFKVKRKVVHMQLIVLEEITQAWEIDRNTIEQMYVIGKGQFGEVYKGTFRSDPCEFVAIKTVKPEIVGDMNDAQFMIRKDSLEKSLIMEAETMKKLKANHIVSLKGFCLKYKPYMVFMEYMENKDLRSFVLENKPWQQPQCTNNSSYQPAQEFLNVSAQPKYKLRPFVHMALEIADGMAYLERTKIVHRDLAARNCMVSSESSGFTVKIGDFGLSRLLDKSNYYIPQADFDKPYRWMAPETFKESKFSSKSDVFSFGVVLWELVTFGETPYPVI